MMPICGQRLDTGLASAKPSIVPGIFTSVNRRRTSDSASRNSSASSLFAASISRKPASEKMPVPERRVKASSSTIRIKGDMCDTQVMGGNIHPGISFHGSAPELIGLAFLDDRFHESCRKRGIHLGFRTPI